MLVREAPAIDDHDSIATIAEEFQIPADHLPTHLDPDQQLAWILEQAKSAARIPPDLTLEQLRRVLKLEQAIVGATRSYGPSSAYTGPITLIRAQEIPVDGMPEDLGWSDVCGAPLEIVFTPGNHLTMMNPPHVAVLAGLLRSALNSGVDVEGVVEEANVPT
jgi:thioesterase domain-containing protein